MKLKTRLIIAKGAYVWLKWCSIIIFRKLCNLPTDHVNHGFATDGINAVYKPLNISINIENKIGKIPKDKPLIIVGNHPVTTAFYAVAQAVAQDLKNPNPRFLAALKYSFTPLGIALKLLNGIPISQTNKKHALQSIKYGLKHGLGAKDALMFYPDGHRAFLYRLQENQARLRKEGDVANAERYRYTLCGRVIATQTVAHANLDAMWVKMYVTFDNPFANSLKDLEAHENSTIHIQISEIPPPPKDREGIKQWNHDHLFGPCNDWIDAICMNAEEPTTMLQVQHIR